MNKASICVAAMLIPAISPIAVSQPTAELPSKKLIETGASGIVDLPSGIKPTSDQVTYSVSAEPGATGLAVTIQHGAEQYPGLHLTPNPPWDLSNYGHVDAVIANTGTNSLGLSMRLDNNLSGAQSNTESTTIKPSQSGTVRVYFGYGYGRKPAYQLDTAKIQNILFFSGNPKGVASFRVVSLEAAGSKGEKPPIDPGSIRTKPVSGYLFGGSAPFDPAKQIEAKGGAKAEPQGSSIKVLFPPKNEKQTLLLKPAIGRWDLREAYQVRVKLKNAGSVAATPSVQVGSNGGPTDTITATVPIAPGASGEVVVPFAPSVPWTGIKDSAKTAWNPTPGTGTKFSSDAVTNVSISLDPGTEERALTIESVTGEVPKSPEMPDWLGKRPPVDGDWVQTFSEEFDGTAIDDSKWRIYTENYWDKRSHFSKENVILAGGVVKLRFEKKTGRHNDDPNGKETPYATGFLDTYGKWVQRYGYFESRMKLTKGPGMWPAFWLMPDRGAEAGPQWKRADTGNGGMEFDIMEFLGRWGQYRFNVAMHWDGYGKGHQQTGSQCIYFLPDKDGFVTSGILWEPGKVTIYANAKVVAVWESPRISNVQSDLMFTAVSGGWDNDGIDDSRLPDDFVIDYVRCWQRKDWASNVDGPVRQPAATAQAR